MASSHHAWLLKQLPEWEREGLIGAESAATLRKRSERARDEQGGQLGLVIFGVIGAALVAAGVIAVLAYNWDSFPRWARLLVAFLPMLGGQAAAAWCLRGGESVSHWIKESVAVFLGISVGTCIAIVSQVYSLGGNWRDFVLAWSLLAFPVVPLLNSSCSASLYLLGITSWATESSFLWRSHRWMETMWYPVLLLPLLLWWPGRNWSWKNSPPLGFCWVAAPCLMWASLIITKDLPDMANLADMAMVLSLAAVFVLLPTEREGFGHRPFLVCGSVVLFCAGLFLGFDTFGLMKDEGASQVFNVPLFWLYLILGVWLVYKAVLDKRWASLTIASIALMPFLLASLPPGMAWLLVNVQLAATGILMIMPAFKGEDGGSPRLGAALLSLVVLARFLSSSLPLLLKGFGFIIVGIGFIVFNIVLARRAKAARPVS